MALDIFSTVPWDLLMTSGSLRLAKLFKVSRVVKLVRIVRVLKLIRILRLLKVCAAGPSAYQKCAVLVSFSSRVPRPMQAPVLFKQLEQVCHAAAVVMLAVLRKSHQWAPIAQQHATTSNCIHVLCRRLVSFL